MGVIAKRANVDVEELALNLRQGRRSALARAITLVESRNKSHASTAAELLQLILPHTGGAYRIGVSGAPGVGKSTFIDAIGNVVLKAGYSVAVLAVDPSSVRTHGSILGDKTRMSRVGMATKAFVRPSPTSGSLGGVAAMTRETILLCEAAGYDIVLVETVGVGQSEHIVAEMVDFFLALMLPGSGDELQGIKKGILEVADMIVVNKADGNTRHAAGEAAIQYERALGIAAAKVLNWRVPAMTASALTEEGVSKVWETIRERIDALRRMPASLVSNAKPKSWRG